MMARILKISDTNIMQNKISFIIPSINRSELKRTIDSIDLVTGDEIILEFDKPKSFAWGNPQRNKGMARAKGNYLAFIDDDDWYVEHHREMMDLAIKQNPGVPILFKLQYPNGKIIWDKPELVPGNVSTQMILVPNIPSMLHYWEGKRNMADFIFMDKWKWTKDQIIWRPEIIAMLSHDDGEKI